MQVEVTLPVPGEQAHHEDLRHRGRRDREEHAEEAEELAADHQRDEHPDRRETDLVADDAGGDHEALEHLDDRVRGHHADDLTPALPAEEAHQQGQDERGGAAHVGDERDQAGDDADRDREAHPGDGVGDRVEHREGQHHQHLPADELAEDLVDLAGHVDHERAVAVRHQVPDARGHAVEVVEQIEGDHRHDEQARHHRQERGRAAPDPARDRAHHRGRAPGEIGRRQIAALAAVLHQRAEVVERVRHLHAVAGEPRLHRAADPLELLGQLAREERHLPDHHRHEHQRAQRHRAEGQRQEDHDPDRARQASLLEAIHQRIEQVGDEEREEDRREHAAERVDREPHPGDRDQREQPAREPDPLGRRHEVF